MAALLLHVLPVEFPHEFCLYEFKYIFFFFMCGTICADYALDKKYLSRVGRIAFILLPANWILVALNYTDMYAIKLVLALNGILGVLWISYHIARYYPNVLTGVATSSYIIYLFHTTFEGFTKTILQYVLPVAFQTFILPAILIIASGVLCPILLDRYIISKNKITKYLFGLKIQRL